MTSALSIEGPLKRTTSMEHIGPSHVSTACDAWAEYLQRELERLRAINRQRPFEASSARPFP